MPVKLRLKFKRLHSKTSSAKWRPYFFGLNVFKENDTATDQETTLRGNSQSGQLARGLSWYDRNQNTVSRSQRWEVQRLWGPQWQREKFKQNTRWQSTQEIDSTNGKINNMRNFIYKIALY